jgi:hypothetical protein
MRALLLLPFLLAAALLPAACGSTGKSEGQRRLGELTEALGALGRELQEARAELVAAVVDHDVLVGLRDPDLIGRYRSFEEHLSACEARQERLRRGSERMASSAVRYFDHWEQELSLIAGEELREQSAKRLRKTRRQYEDLRGEVDGVVERFAPLLAALRDQATYLGVDLNSESLTGLRSELPALQGATQQLYRAVDEASIATHAFTGAVRN